MLVGPAAAGVVTHSGGTVMASRLHPAERRAITVQSISATGETSLGLIVTVTFEGDIERYLGQGDLRTALVALLLVPGSPNQAPGGVLDGGGGSSAVRVPVLRRGAVERATINTYSPEQVQHMLTAGQATVLRSGNQLTFYISPAAVAHVAQVKLKVFARTPARGALWHAILNTKPAALATATIDQSKLTCTQLRGAGSGLSRVLATAVEPELHSQQTVRAELKSDIAAFARIHHAAPNVSKSALTGALRDTVARIGRLNIEVSNLSKLIAQINGLIKTCAPPPPPPPVTTTTTTVTSPPPPPPPPPITVVQTDAGLSQYMASEPGLTTSSTSPSGLPVIDVNDQVHYQRFEGLGAAMTDSSAWLIYDELPAQQRTALMQALFGDPRAQNSLGAPAIHLNFLRVGIGADRCDDHHRALQLRRQQQSGRSDPDQLLDRS